MYLIFRSLNGIFTFHQIHLSLAPDGLSYIVTWSTLDSTKNLNGSFVEYGSNPKNLTQRSKATETKFVANGPKNLTQYFHRALIGPNWTQDTAYFYRVGSNVTLSDLFFCHNIQTELTCARPYYERAMYVIYERERELLDSYLFKGHFFVRR